MVNWRRTVTQILTEHASATLSDPASSLPSTVRLQASVVDWVSFAQAWRNSYKDFIRDYAPPPSTVDDDSPPLKTVDQHHHESLIHLLESNGLSGLWPADEVLEISRIWHFLEPWPDSSSGIRKLNDLGVQTCTLSNGNLGLLNDMAKYAHLPWTRVFSAEQFGAYKPSPKVYKGAVKKLGYRVEECAMVAAHLVDLMAAKECGLKTIYVEREMEEDWTVGADWNAEEIDTVKQEGWVDIWVGLQDGDDGNRGILEVVKRLQAT